MTGLPLDGRNFLELSLLAPGASPAAQGSAGSVRGDFAFNINGSREDANNFLLDGVYNVDPKLNTFGVKPPVDAIREFEVLTSAYDASFGRSAGAQVNIVLKSGTNRFHGTAYEFLRNQVLDARNFFAPPISLTREISATSSVFHSAAQWSKTAHSSSAITKARVSRRHHAAGQRADGSRTHGRFFAEPFRAAAHSRNQFRSPAVKFRRDCNPIGWGSRRSTRCRTGAFRARISCRRRSSATATTSSTCGSTTHSARPRSFRRATVSLTAALRAIFRRDTGFRARLRQQRSPPRTEPDVQRNSHFLAATDQRRAHGFQPCGNQVLVENAGVSVNRQVGLPELSNDPRDFGLSFIRVTGFSPLGHEFNNPQNSATNVYQVLDTATYARGATCSNSDSTSGRAAECLSRCAIARPADFPVASRVQTARRHSGCYSVHDRQRAGRSAARFAAGHRGARLDNHQHLRTESYNFFVNDSFRVRRD